MQSSGSNSACLKKDQQVEERRGKKAQRTSAHTGIDRLCNPAAATRRRCRDGRGLPMRGTNRVSMEF